MKQFNNEQIIDRSFQQQQVSFNPSNDVVSDQLDSRPSLSSAPQFHARMTTTTATNGRPQRSEKSRLPFTLFPFRRKSKKMTLEENFDEKPRKNCNCWEQKTAESKVKYSERKDGDEKHERKSKQDDGKKDENEAGHPFDRTSLFGRLFFSWMLRFIWIGWRYGLKKSDLPREPNSDELCEKVGKQLDANWRREIRMCNWQQQSTTTDDNNSGGRRDDAAEQKQPSLVRVVTRTHLKWILINSLLTLFAEVLCKSLIAFSVGQMLFYMNNRQFNSESDEDEDSARQQQQQLLTSVYYLITHSNPLHFWTFTLIFVSFFWVLSAHYYGFQMMRVGLQVRIGCSYLIYKKSLKLSQTNQSNQTTLGKMINLLSNDLDKFNHICVVIPFLWIGPIQTLVSIGLLWPQLGPSCLGSLLILAILTPIQFYLSQKFASFRRQIAASTDDRVNSLNETIQSIKTIKLYGWEMPIRCRLFALRDNETDLISRVAIIKGFSAALMYVSSKMVLFVTILLHCLIFEQTLDAKTLFMSMAMLNNVQFTMTQLMPRVVSLGAEALVSLKRINDFLLQKEFSRSNKLWIVDWTARTGDLARRQSTDRQAQTDCFVKPSSLIDGLSALSPSSSLFDQNKLMPIIGGNNRRSSVAIIDHCAVPFVQCQNVGARWPTTTSSTSSSSAKTLEGITFRCQSPELIIICGQVASGKSSLFVSLLNELPIDEGTAQISGSLSYSSQVAWLFNGTIRDNILFGQQFQQERYWQVIEICSLRSDLNSLDLGDQTYIQEDSLSGGQKARVSLARCLYRQCDIYLLDDPLSALDSRVAEHIFEQAICKFLANKLVLLATHQVKYLSRCDKILLLDQGKQLAYCEYDKLTEIFAAPIGVYFTRKQYESLAFLKQTDHNISPMVKMVAGSNIDHSHREDGQQFDAQNQIDPNNTKNNSTKLLSLPNNRRAVNNIRQRVPPNDDETIDHDHSTETNRGKFDVWFKYYRENSCSRLIVVFLAFLCTQALFSTVDVYLTVWSMSEQNRAQLVDIGQSNQFWLENIKNNQAGFINYQMKTSTTAAQNKFRGDHQRWNNQNGSSLAQINYDVGTKNINGLQQHQQLALISSVSNEERDIVGLLLSPLPGHKTRDDKYLFYNHNLDANVSSSIDSEIIFRDNTEHQSNETAATDQDDDEVNRNIQQQIDLLEGNDGDQLIKLDEDEILLESQEALNVKPIYRPLYLFVNNLSSSDHATIYTCLLLALFSSSALTNILSLKCCNLSARNLYRKLIDSALCAQMSFYDQNPIGRFLNRATRDFGIIDEAIPYNINQAYDALLQTAATLIVVTIVDFKLAPVSAIVVLVVFAFYTIQIGPTKDIQRFEGIARSPLLSHVSGTLNGLQTIRSCQSASDRLLKQFSVIQDAHSSVWQLKIGCNRTTAIYLDLFNALYISLVALSAVLSADAPGAASSAGLIITSAILLCGLTQHGVMKLTETESLLTSVERVLEYCSLPQEESWAQRGVRRPNSQITNNLAAVWPNEGRLEFKNVDLYYSTKEDRQLVEGNKKPVLKNLSFEVRPREKIGIIGRTGAGKSSLISVLFRLHDFDGQVLLDGVDTKTLNLIELRTNIGIIPQSPVLFSSVSIRENLDPFGAHDDFSIWSALNKAHLRETINQLPGKLNCILDDSCEQFSAGQKQLVCLARILLRRDKLIVLDEATANVDPTTDAIIQTTIRNEFKDCTILTIAHRLETILDCDRIMCLDSGRLVDFDTPQSLASRSDSYFAKMMQQKGTTMKSTL